MKFLLILLLFLALTPSFLSAGNIEGENSAEKTSECGVSANGPSSVIAKYMRHKDMYIVSTLDGKVTALDAPNNGRTIWSYSTNDDGLLSSTIGDFQFVSGTNYFKLVPALDGSLYKLNEQYNILEPIPLNADILLKSSFKLGDDLLVNGGKEVRTYAIDLMTGQLIYTCGLGDCTYYNNDPENASEVSIVIIRQLRQKVRAVNPRNGAEQWRFTVGENSAVLYSQAFDDCRYFDVSKEKEQDEGQSLKLNIPEGFISVEKDQKEVWSRKFDSPIVTIWRYRLGKLSSVDLFSSQDQSSDPFIKKPSVYIGTHKNQLYIQHSGYFKERFLELAKVGGASAIRHSVTPLLDWKLPHQDKHLQVSLPQSNGLVQSFERGEFLYFEDSNDATVLITLLLLGASSFVSVIFLLKTRSNPYVEIKSIGKISFNSKNIIGYGSSGTCVFKGLFENKQEVAVKRVIVDYFTLAEREIELLRNFHHQNLIRYFATESDDIFKYIAIELAHFSLADYVEGQTVKIDPQLDDIDILYQSSLGIEHLHALNIIHRDIKPQNILISMPVMPANKRKVMISDFGVSKQVTSSASMSNDFVATTQILRGTEGWIAPEVIQNKLSKDSFESIKSAKPVDIFSLGCLFCYVLTKGQHPFGSSLERQSNILKGKHSMDTLSGDENLIKTNLIESMISCKPEDRPTIEAVVKHPIFWSSQRQLSFLQDVSDRLEKASPDSDPVQCLEKGGFDVVKGDWRKHITDDLREDLTKFRSYRGNSVRDLLRGLRNKKHHYRELNDELQQSLGTIPDEFVSYFTTRFPRLLIHSYIAMQNFRDELIFREYYDQMSTFIPLPKTWRRYYDTGFSKNGDWKKSPDKSVKSDINENKTVADVEKNWRTSNSVDTSPSAKFFKELKTKEPLLMNESSLK